MNQDEIKILLEELYSKTVNDNLSDFKRLYNIVGNLISILMAKEIITIKETKKILTIPRDIIESDDK